MRSKSNPPIVTQHPQSKSAVYGDKITLSVVAHSESDTLSYQWLKDGMPITDTRFCDQFKTPNLHIVSFSPRHAGTYTCRVSNSEGSVVSDVAEIKGKLLLPNSYLMFWPHYTK